MFVGISVSVVDVWSGVPDGPSVSSITNLQSEVGTSLMTEAGENIIV